VTEALPFPASLLDREAGNSPSEHDLVALANCIPNKIGLKPSFGKGSCPAVSGGARFIALASLNRTLTDRIIGPLRPHPRLAGSPTQGD
jgi:hypothetical protein